MPGRVLTILALGLAALALAVYLLFFRTSARHATDAASGTESDDGERDPLWPGAATGPNQTGSPGAHPVLDRKRADEMRERIRALLAEAGPAWAEPETMVEASAAGHPEMPGPVGSGGLANQAKEAQGRYIRSVMRDEFFPLAAQCYENLSAKHPGLTLDVELDFRIVGDKRVGGVVDEASLGDAGAPLDPEFERCMTQSMMSVSFDAPPNGGEVTVKYPLVLAPDPPDE